MQLFLLRGSYYVGAEDRTGMGADYDFNDFVFTLSGAGLTLNSSGTLSNPITPNNNGSPFWDKTMAQARTSGTAFIRPHQTPAPARR